MVIKIIELLAAHGGIIAVFLGVPYLTLSIAVAVLWKNSNKDKERIMTLIEDKVKQDTKLEAAFNSLTEVIKAKRG